MEDNFIFYFNSFLTNLFSTQAASQASTMNNYCSGECPALLSTSSFYCSGIESSAVSDTCKQVK